MDKFWLEKAHKYISEHNAFENVSDITIKDSDCAIITATVIVGLPSKFIKVGITNIGVQKKENIRFVFSNDFPLKAPMILLRDDFPRCFPHINPSINTVNPCIYEGDLSELLQQSEWMNAILNQLVDWLEKAASNDLLNYEQGWEPMRNDEHSGFIFYDIDNVLKGFNNKKNSVLTNSISYEEQGSIIIAGNLLFHNKKKNAHALYFLTDDVFDKYIPNTIRTLNDLYQYSQLIGLSNIKEIIEKCDIDNISESKLFIILSIKRPVNIIGTNNNIEFLNFVIHKSKSRKKKKRTLLDCKISMLTHIADNSQTLLKQLSGTNTKINESKSIAIVGCGSLGSKIGIHLARNGNGPFLCIDNEIFLPHNNSRHALTFTMRKNKAELLSIAMFNMSNVHAKSITENAYTVDYTNTRYIIDTTASFSVRQFLMSNPNLPPIISGGLYSQGKYGFLLIESQSKTTLLSDMWAHLYLQTLKDNELRDILFSIDEHNVHIGQSCSSQTMIIDDSKISIFAAVMSSVMQKMLENSLPKNGNIYFIKYNENYSLTTKVIDLPSNIHIHSISKKEWHVVLSTSVHKKMIQIMNKKAPCETGGVLLGSVFLYPKKIVITEILPAPPDSIEKVNLFILGTKGLEKNIKKIEKKTNGKVTYLGTWHSHPQGGNASNTDNKTYNRLLFVRNYEPTICIIVTPDEVVLV